MNAKPTRRITFKNTHRSFPNNAPGTLKPEKPTVQYSYLSNFLPANHYNTLRRNAKTRKNQGRPYPYAAQNAHNVARIIERVGTEQEAIATLDILFPNTLTPHESLIMDQIMQHIKQTLKTHLDRIVQTVLRKKYLEKGLSIPEEEYNTIASSLFRRFLKDMVHDVSTSHFAEDMKQRLVDQLRKKIVLELLRKGWFGANPDYLT